MISDGLLTECSDANAKISRETIAKAAAAALKLNASLTGDSPFSDSGDTPIRQVYEAGIIEGYPDGTFRPDAQITRAEISTIVWRIMNYKK